MTRSPETLRAIGLALYGNCFQSQLAEALGVSDRTMRRWLCGDSSLPEGIWSDLADLCSGRASEMEGWRKAIIRSIPL